MLPAEKLDAERIMAPPGELTRGARSPDDGDARGGQVAGRGAGRRSLVLIHDDADNCQQDACAAAAELRAPGVIVHVVGLGLKPDGPREDGLSAADRPAGASSMPRNAEQVGTLASRRR